MFASLPMSVYLELVKIDQKLSFLKKKIVLHLAFLFQAFSACCNLPPAVRPDAKLGQTVPGFNVIKLFFSSSLTKTKISLIVSPFSCELSPMLTRSQRGSA